ncbi:MAG: cytochrome c3 family protein [Deltaproteobacteria bacterium]|nr:cytochrome c3 family protein [Deltaproteobacteria bacterium]
MKPITPENKLTVTSRKNRGPFALAAAALVSLLLFLYYFYAFPGRGMGPEQPIPFSHRIHAGVKEIHCQFCHPYVNYSRSPGIPPVEKCLFCHKYIIARHPEILKEHEYFNSGTPTPWVKVNYLPEHVFFNHMRHIRKQIACEECHGSVKAMERMQGMRFMMGFCIECHQKKKANVGCWLACHN